MLYRNMMTGETRTYDGWKQWAENFYSSLGYDEQGRDVNTVKRINVMMPSDWFRRVTRVLKLEPIDTSIAGL